MVDQSCECRILLLLSTCFVPPDKDIPTNFVTDPRHQAGVFVHLLRVQGSHGDTLVLQASVA